MLRSWIVGWACVAFAGAVAAAERPPAMSAGHVLTFSYIEKPPYYSTAPNGVPGGFLLERTRRVLADAGITPKFVSLPAKRALADIEDARQEACAIGWFKTPARVRFARFSAPLYRDLPFLLVARRGAAVSGGGLFDILANEKLKIGIVAGYSYGERIDSALMWVGSRVETLGNPEQAYRFMAAGRADVALFNREEFDHFAQIYPDLAGELMRLDLTDTPPGEFRHLMCSQAVEPQVIERINAAISRLDQASAKGAMPRQ